MPLYLLFSASLSDFLVALVLVVACLWIHEFLHVLVSGLAGNKIHPQDLKPSKIFDVVGWVMVLFLGVGWSKRIPVGEARLNQNHGLVGLYSFVGIIWHLLVVFALLWGKARAEVFGLSDIVVSCLVFTNLSLAVVNILPLEPLDGVKIWSGLTGAQNASAVTPPRGGASYILVLLMIFFQSPWVNFIQDLTARINQRFFG